MVESGIPEPGTNLVAIKVIGGPKDGADLYVPRAVLDAADPDGWSALPLFTAAGDPATDEPYVGHFSDLSPVQGVVMGRWVAFWMHYPAIANAVKLWMDNRDPEPHPGDEPQGIVLCPPGEHDWSPWTETAGGNRTRHCSKCDVSQGAVV